MPEAWRCQHCVFEAFDERAAQAHSRLFPSHGVVRRVVAQEVVDSVLAARLVCEACPFETQEKVNALRHTADSGAAHRCVLVRQSRTHPAREQASPMTTGPGALLTDGEHLYEVTDARRRKVKAGTRTLEVPERRLRDVKDELMDDPGGAWIAMGEVLVLEVVRAVKYEEPSTA